MIRLLLDQIRETIEFYPYQIYYFDPGTVRFMSSLTIVRQIFSVFIKSRFVSYQTRWFQSTRAQDIRVFELISVKNIDENVHGKKKQLNFGFH